MNIKFAFAVAAAAVALASQAQATVVKITFDGVVNSGIDVAGLFGAAGANLAGSSFEATETFTINGPAKDQASVDGGFQLGLPPAAFDPHIVINGHDFAPTSEALGEAGYAEYGPPGPVLPFSFVSTWLFARNTTATTDVHIFAGTTADTLSFFPGGVTAPAAIYGGSGLSAYGDQLSMTTKTFTITPAPSGVPEPAAWAMMVLGLGLAGAALRGRGVAPAAVQS